MRAKMIVVGGLALLASACGGKDQAGASANADTGLTASSISSNDVTAIDAVTGEAANMAADMDFTNVQSNAAETGGKGPSQSSGVSTRRDSTASPAQNSAQPQPEPEAATEPANATE